MKHPSAAFGHNQNRLTPSRRHRYALSPNQVFERQTTWTHLTQSTSDVPLNTSTPSTNSRRKKKPSFRGGYSSSQPLQYPTLAVELVIRHDRELRQRIRKDFGNDQAQITDASLLFVIVTADIKAWIKDPQAGIGERPERSGQPVGELDRPLSTRAVNGCSATKPSVRFGMAMQTIMLAAKDDGLRLVPHDRVRYRDEVAELMQPTGRSRDGVPSMALWKTPRDPLAETRPTAAGRAGGRENMSLTSR